MTRFVINVSYRWPSAKIPFLICTIARVHISQIHHIYMIYISYVKSIISDDANNSLCTYAKNRDYLSKRSAFSIVNKKQTDASFQIKYLVWKNITTRCFIYNAQHVNHHQKNNTKVIVLAFRVGIWWQYATQVSYMLR